MGAPTVAFKRAQARSRVLHGVCNRLWDGLSGVANPQADDLCIWVLFLVGAPPPRNLRQGSHTWCRLMP